MSTQPLLQSAPGKRIALPVRVEPKVFFANERTFLSYDNPSSVCFNQHAILCKTLSVVYTP